MEIVIVMKLFVMPLGKYCMYIPILSTFLRPKSVDTIDVSGFYVGPTEFVPISPPPPPVLSLLLSSSINLLATDFFFFKF